MGTDGAKVLVTALASLKNLTHLDLSRNSIGVTRAIELAKGEIPSKPFILDLPDAALPLTLDLSGNHIGVTRAIKLANGVIEFSNALPSLKNLTHLDLGYNMIGDDSAKILARVLRGNKSLIDLNLNFTNIGESGAMALVRALRGNTTLRVLNLRNSNIPGMTKEHLRIIAAQKKITLTLD